MENDLELKNPKHNTDGSIDLELNHPKFGWIPFTASPNDTEQHGRVIFEDAASGKYGEVAPYVAPVDATNQ